MGPFPGFTVPLLAWTCCAGFLQAGELHGSRANTIRIHAYAGRYGSHTLEWVKGQGAGDRICIGPGRTGQVTATLTKPGDRFVFPTVEQRNLEASWDVTFRPNLANDGASYRVKISNSLSRNGARKDEFVTFKVEKPSSKVYTKKESRVVVIQPDWSQAHFLDPDEALTDALGRKLDRTVQIGKVFKDPQNIDLGTSSF